MMYTPGNVGGPTPCVEVKLQDTDDYKCSDVYPTTKDAFETQVSFKGEFDSEKAGKKMREIIYEKWLLHMERDLWRKESTILQKWRMEESFYTWNAFVVWARVWLRQSRINENSYMKSDMYLRFGYL